jgi:hypothetical protein
MNKPDDNQASVTALRVDELRLGHDNLEFQLQSRNQVAQVAHTLASQAQRSLLLYTRDLEPEIYDQTAFLEALSQLARLHRQTRFRILIADSRHVIQQGHRLIELALRLRSFIEFRRPNPDYPESGETFLLADNAGYLHRPNANRYEGSANFNDPARVTEWRNRFMEVWERSEPDVEIRRLYL